MMRSMVFHALCALFLVGCLSANASNLMPSLEDIYSDAPVPTMEEIYSPLTLNRAIRGVTAKTYLQTCSSSSVSVKGPFSAVASSMSSSQAMTSAISACSKYIVTGFLGANATGECSGTDVAIQVSTVARACARASAKLRTETLSSTWSNGSKAVAMAYGCAMGKVFSQAMAKAVVDAVAQVFASGTFPVNGTEVYNKVPCNALANANATAFLSATAKILTNGFASASSYALTVGKGKAKSGAHALFYSDVAVYTKVIGYTLVRACAVCSGVPGKGKCAFCDNAMFLEDDAQVTSDSLAEVSEGRIALTSAFSDAAATVCKGKKEGINVHAVAETVLNVTSNVCTKVVATACGWLTTSGKSVACSRSSSSGSAFALSKAIGNMISYAAADAFKKNKCAANAMAGAIAEVTANFPVKVFSKAAGDVCIKKLPDGSYPASRQLSYIASTVKGMNDKRAATAMADAFNAIYSKCNCEGAGFCCNCEERSCEDDQY